MDLWGKERLFVASIVFADGLATLSARASAGYKVGNIYIYITIGGTPKLPLMYVIIN